MDRVDLPPRFDPAVDGRIPDQVLRQWSDALAAAGMFPEALQSYPARQRADLVRRAELAVLAGEHLTALSVLAELKEARTRGQRS